MPNPKNIQTPANPLYPKARQLLQGTPDMGKGRLAKALGIKTPSARRLIERYRGETLGHNNTNPDYVRVLQLKQQHPDWGAGKIAQTLGMTEDHAKLHLARWVGTQSCATASPSQAQMPHPQAPKAAPAGTSSSIGELEDSDRGDERDLCYRGSRIKTLEDLLVYAQVDDRVWFVEHHVINKYEMGVKNPVTGEITVQELVQIKAWLKRRTGELRLEKLRSTFLEEFLKAAPVRPPISYHLRGRGVLEISLMDLHLGKLAWAPESGRTYNADIAAEMFWTALEDLLAKASGCGIEKFLFVAGNDFLNTDNLGRTTTAGTPQDEMVRWPDALVRGKDLLIKAIGKLREQAPVHVLMVQGNHDTQKIFCIGEILQAWFRNTPGVTVDNSPAQRKYFHFGRCLIGFTHGCNERHASLPLLMATERRQEWGQSIHREIHLGHYHSRKSKMFVPAVPFVPTEDIGGVLVRILPSLCPADAWHASMGYSGKLAADAYYWDPNDGCVATFTHSPA